MNSRIKELAEQSTKKLHGFSYRFGHRTETIFDEEKFAKLIVQECIDYCGENLSKTVGGALKIHMGVDDEPT